METSPDFKTLQDEIQSALIATTRSVNQISSEDLTFHRSLNRKVGEELDEKSNRLLQVAQSLLKSTASVSGLKAPELEDVDDVESNWRGVVDVVDSLLEKADTSLDEYTGVIKRKGTEVVEESTSKKHPSQLGKTFRNQNLLKPQLAFEHKPQNFDDSPWKPLLTSKPHALIPLEESLNTFTDQLEHKQYRHPYEAEILQLQYPESIYQKADPIKYLPIETTTATWVDTFEGVQNMLEELKGVTEIAVDLEHHDTRTYLGLVSLMQISTRKKDWIVDTLKPWRQDLQILNEVFTNPNIIKVFHGAFMDIVWLQRDLGLYVTGLFDTFHASRALGYPGGSLAYLLKRFINFDADKKYQMADWRIRPLPQEMFFYARSDTHFLLYIYDNVRNELVDKSNPADPENNRIEMVLQKSKETSLTYYKKDIYDRESGKGPGGWFTLLSKTPQIQTNEQVAIFQAIHAWRDQVARTDDDSVNFVMPNQALVSISKQVPTDIATLYSIIHSFSNNVKSRVDELLDVIKKAQAAGVDGPTAMDILKPGTVGAITKQIRQADQSVPEASSRVKPFTFQSENSKFWGGAFGSSIWDSPVSTLKSLREGLTLAVPMPQLSSEMFSSQTPIKSQAHNTGETALKAATEDETMKEDKLMFPSRYEDDSAFVLKNGLKRKSDAMASGADLDEVRDQDILALDEADEIALDRRKAKRQRNKSEAKSRKAERKQARKESSQHSNIPPKTSGSENEDAMEVDEIREGEVKVEEEEDFDYSKAESVLHSKSRGAGAGAGFGEKKEKKGKGGKKPGSSTPFDPYSKSANAAKGMRRQQSGGDGEKGSRSMTFKK